MINKKDTILFIGLGGAGQRHLRILRKLLPENKFIGLRKTKKTPLLNPDFTIDHSQTLEEKYSIKVIEDENHIANYEPKLTIISTPTSFLSKYSQIAHKIGSNVFVEKPGIASYEEYKKIKNIFKKSSLTYNVGFQRKFDPLYIKLKEIISSLILGKIISVKVEVSSYVPEWHPYEDYKKLYACRSELGGGVLLTESHEIDMICDLLGQPKKIDSKLIKNSKYKLDIYDTAFIKIDFDQIKVEFDLSLFRKPLSRKLNFEFEKGNISYDVNLGSLVINSKKGKKVKNLTPNNDELFLNQAKKLIKLENNNKKLLSNLKNVSKIIDLNSHNKKIFSINNL